jgi:MFS family permease
MGAVAPIVAGFLAENYGYNAIFYIALTIFVISLFVLKFKVKVN